MKIKKLEIDGFRCLLDFKIIFEDDLTVIVGENDSGKTSLIECLKVVTQNKSIAIDDFNHGKDIISLKVEIENFIFEKTYKVSKAICLQRSSYLVSCKGVLSNAFGSS